jgi:hypothetical protein
MYGLEGLVQRKKKSGEVIARILAAHRVNIEPFVGNAFSLEGEAQIIVLRVKKGYDSDSALGWERMKIV